MSASFAEMSAHLRSSIGNVSESAETLATTSHQLGGVSEQVTEVVHLEVAGETGPARTASGERVARRDAYIACPHGNTR